MTGAICVSVNHKGQLENAILDCAPMPFPQLPTGLLARQGLSLIQFILQICEGRNEAHILMNDPSRMQMQVSEEQEVMQWMQS
jgi:hypothetical protein